MNPRIFLGVAICLGVLGQMLMKTGTRQSGNLELSAESARLVLTNPFIIGGVLSYALSSVFYIIVVSKLQMSYVYPMIAISYVAVVLLLRVFFGEQIPPLRWAALAVICIGVTLLACSEQRSDQLSGHPDGQSAVVADEAPQVGDP
jgi:multidrug transporter EmrE-like cation transporter